VGECSKERNYKLKFRKSLSVLPLLCLCGVTLSAASAYGQASLDAQIQGLREGKRTTISDSEFLKDLDPTSLISSWR
jgi:hypothetical protein